MLNTYVCIKTDAGNRLFEGQKAQPYYEDENEIIIAGMGVDYDHHIKKDGAYFAEHLRKEG